MNHPLAAAMVTDLSITHSPTSRYESIHFLTSLLSVILSVWKLGLGPRWALLAWWTYGCGGLVERERESWVNGGAHVKPVDLFMPARMVETATRLVAAVGDMVPVGVDRNKRRRRHTEHGIKCIVS